MSPITAKRQFSFAAIPVFAATLLGQTPSPGSLSGTVAGIDGKPVSATVIANRIGAPPGTARVDSAADGSFTLPALPAGTYSLCVADNNSGYLDPCVWSLAVPQAAIPAGKAVTGFKIALEKGVPLQVRLNDPAKVLGATPGPNTTVPHLLIGVFSDRHLFVPAGLVSQDAAGRNHEAQIPFDRPVVLHLKGKFVSVSDAKGAAVDVVAGTSFSVQHPSGAPGAAPAPASTAIVAAPLTFTVSAKP